MSLNVSRRSEFAKNALTLVTGTSIAQVIPVLLQPVLRRIFTPEEFGYFAVYLSITSILTVIATLRYELAIVLPEKDEDAGKLLIASWVINLAFCILVALCIILLDDSLLQLLALPPDQKYLLYITPVGVFLFSFYQSINYWLIRKKAFKASAFNKMVRRGTEGASQVGFGFLQYSPGLIAGDIIGKVALAGLGLYQSFRSGFQLTLTGTGNLRKSLKRYIEFPKYNALPSLLNTASLMLPIIFINKLFTSDITGQVNLSLQVLALPLALISTAISQVLFTRIAEKRGNNERFSDLVLKIFLILAGLSVVGIILVQLLSVPLFTWIFGNEWLLAAQLTETLVFSYAIRFIISPLSIILTALERLKYQAAWQISYFIVILSLSLYNNMSIISFLRMYVIYDLTMYTIYLGIIIFAIGRYNKTGFVAHIK